MRITILVTDVFVRFRLIAIMGPADRPQAWEMQVMCIEQVADILVYLGLLDSETATRLARASTTITPQPGITTTPMTYFAMLTELVYPDEEPVSAEAQQGYVLIALGETTEEALAAAGFVSKLDSPVQ